MLSFKRVFFLIICEIKFFYYFFALIFFAK